MEYGAERLCHMHAHTQGDVRFRCDGAQEAPGAEAATPVVTSARLLRQGRSLHHHVSVFERSIFCSTFDKGQRMPIMLGLPTSVFGSLIR